MEQALALHRSGRLADAAARCLILLRRPPRRPDALRLLGLIRVQQGRLSHAAALMAEAVERDASSAEGHNNYGMILHALRRSNEAIAHYEAALVIRPQYAIALNNLGIALAAVGRTDEAIARYEQALAIEPDYAEALNNLGAALSASDRHVDAVVRFRACLKIRAAFWDARMNLGIALTALGRAREAVTHLQAVVPARPGDARGHASLAAALYECKRFDEAAAHYRKAITVDPGLAAAHAGLGSILVGLGQFEAAECHFKQAIAAEPGTPRHYLQLVRVSRLSNGDPHLDAMLEMEAQADAWSQEDRIDLHFALGKALADADEHERSFHHLTMGNKLRRRAVSYDEASELAPMGRAAAVYQAKFIQELAGFGDKSALPVFILGMPRSGSTLIEQILASHPNVFAAGERTAFRDAMRVTGFHSRQRPFPNAVATLQSEKLHELGSDYIRRLSSLVPSGSRRTAMRVTDKMPANFRYVGLIHLALPNARIIHTCRDPIDTCLSCYSLLFGKLPFTYDLGELGRHYRAYAQLMRHWREVLPAGVMLDVQYERLVANFEEEARRIVAYCGLEWNDACLRFYKTERIVHTASATQVRQPIHQHSVGRWRPDEETLRPLLDGLQMATTC